MSRLRRRRPMRKRSLSATVSTATSRSLGSLATNNLRPIRSELRTKTSSKTCISGPKIQRRPASECCRARKDQADAIAMIAQGLAQAQKIGGAAVRAADDALPRDHAHALFRRRMPSPAAIGQQPLDPCRYGHPQHRQDLRMPRCQPCHPPPIPRLQCGNDELVKQSALSIDRRRMSQACASAGSAAGNCAREAVSASRSCCSSAAPIRCETDVVCLR